MHSERPVIVSVRTHHVLYLHSFHMYRPQQILYLVFSPLFCILCEVGFHLMRASPSLRCQEPSIHDVT